MGEKTTALIPARMRAASRTAIYFRNYTMHKQKTPTQCVIGPQAFKDILYGDTEIGWLTIFYPPSRRTLWFPVADPVPDLEQNCYLGTCIRQGKLGDGGGSDKTDDLECGIRSRSGSESLDPASPRTKPQSGVVKGPDEDSPTTHSPSEHHPPTTRSPSISAPLVPEDPLLKEVIAAWPRLSPEDRQRILAIVQGKSAP